MLREQQGQTSKVGVAAFGVALGTIPLILSSNIVYHISKMVVRLPVVGVGIDQVIFRELENYGDQNEKFSEHLVVQFSMETGNLVIMLFNYPVFGNIFIG